MTQSKSIESSTERKRDHVCCFHEIIQSATNKGEEKCCVCGTIKTSCRSVAGGCRNDNKY